MVKVRILLGLVAVGLSACSDIRLNIGTTCEKYYLTTRLYTSDGTIFQASTDFYDPDQDRIFGYPTPKFQMTAGFTGLYYPIGQSGSRGLWIFGGRGILTLDTLSIHSAPLYSNATMGSVQTIKAGALGLEKGGATFASHARFSSLGKGLFFDIDTDSNSGRESLFEIDFSTGAQTLVQRWAIGTPDFGWSGLGVFTRSGELVIVSRCTDALSPATTCAGVPSTESPRLWAYNSARTASVDFNTGDSLFGTGSDSYNGFSVFDLEDGTVVFSRSLGRNSMAVLSKQDIYRGTIATGAVANLTSGLFPGQHKSVLGVMPRARKILFAASTNGDLGSVSDRPIYYLMNFDGTGAVAVTGLDSTLAYNAFPEDWNDRIFLVDTSRSGSSPPWTVPVKTYLVGSDAVATEKTALSTDDLATVSNVFPMRCL